MHLNTKAMKAFNLCAAFIISAFFSASAAEHSGQYNVRLSFPGALARPAFGSHVLEKLPMLLLDTGAVRLDQPSPRLLAAWRELYPGIDAAVYGDGRSLEYVFLLRPGADPSLLRLSVDGADSIEGIETGGADFIVNGIRVRTSPPRAFKIDNAGETPANTALMTTAGGNLLFNTEEVRAAEEARRNNTRINIIPAGGQPGGPMYNFYASRYEATNDQILNFLNSVENNPGNAIGRNIFFDEHGNAWINPAMQSDRDEAFAIDDSLLEYNPAAPAGQRFNHVVDKDGNKPYAVLPAGGLSWYGAVKYSNWLTLISGRGESELCYSEGTNTWNWAPVTSTNWHNGHFSEQERQHWLTKKGFRLPMLDSNPTMVNTNQFNEFYKMAAWNGKTNVPFGFGRREFNKGDANFGIISDGSLLPVGSFDQNRLTPRDVLRPNENFFGIQDLSGNKAEWLNDNALPGRGTERVLAGGSILTGPTDLSQAQIVDPHDTSSGGGLRVTTTWLPDPAVRIHILVSIYADPEIDLAAKPEELEIAVDPPDDLLMDERPEGRPLDIETPPEMRPDRIQYTVPEPPPPPPVPPAPPTPPVPPPHRDHRNRQHHRLHRYFILWLSIPSIQSAGSGLPSTPVEYIPIHLSQQPS